jgi:hypothetical protein
MVALKASRMNNMNSEMANRLLILKFLATAQAQYVHGGAEGQPHEQHEQRDG